MSTSDQLQIPDAAEHDANSLELLRVWIASKDQHIVVRTGVWEDPAAWGIMLSDLMHHVAKAYQQDKGYDLDKTLQRIKEGLFAELSSPSDTTNDNT